jgi:hypothetical protein
VPPATPDHVRGAVYGTILATSLTAGLAEDAALTSADITYWVVVTAAVFYLAHVYAGVVAHTMSVRHRPDLAEIWHEVHAHALMLVATIPAAWAMILAAAGAWSRDTGVKIAVALGVVTLVGWGAALGFRSRFSRPGILISALVCGSFGVAIVVLEWAID